MTIRGRKKVIKKKQEEQFDRARVIGLKNKMLKKDEEYQYWVKLYDKLWDDREKFGETTMKDVFYEVLSPIERHMLNIQEEKKLEASKEYYGY